MPNRPYKRPENKRTSGIRGYVTPREKEILDEICYEFNVSMSDILHAGIESVIKEYRFEGTFEQKTPRIK